MRDQAAGDFLAFQEAVVGRYSVDREIGRGGMGVVYLAHEVALDRPVALKVMPRAMAAQPALRERFLREARTAAKLTHPNIVPIHAVNEAGDFVFFSMAYVQGRTLGERIRGRGPLTSKEAARILQDVSWALAYAHAEGVVHRDVKPDNILLEDGSGRALVTDFGIARHRTQESLTSMGEMLGTAEYMSPEQASGGAVGPESDIYSLGVVGFFAVTGTLPFEGETVASVLAKHLTQPPPKLASVAPEVPAHLADTIDRCLRKDPAERFRDGAALAEALGTVTSPQRELPVPLRVFVRSIRDLVGSFPMVLFLWMAVALIPVVAGDGIAEWPTFVLVVLGLLTASPLISLGVIGRRLLGAGYTLEDGRLALEDDRDHRLEEIRFRYGKGLSWVDGVLRGATWGGFLTVVAALAHSVVFDSNPDLVGAAAIWTWLAGAFGLAVRGKRRRDLIGDIGLEILRGTLARWSFRLGGLGLGDRALGAGAHRPTEMAISIAADRLFEELPRELKRELKGLPETIERLEADARAMRRQVDELDALLVEVGEDAGGGGAEERAALRADLARSRDDARDRMTDAVSALEKIRLGLLRLHAGDDSLPSLTAELGSASELSGAIERLLEGQRDVARLLRPPEPRTDP